MISPGNKAARALPGFEFGCTGSGAEFVALTFSIVEGSEAGETVQWRGYCTEKAHERTIESLRHCGWSGGDITDLTGIDRNMVQLVIEDDTWEGKTRPKVKWVNAIRPSVNAEQRMGDGARAAFAARMRGAVAACDASIANAGQRYEPKNGAGGPPSGADDDPGPGDDDIPF